MQLTCESRSDFLIRTECDRLITALKRGGIRPPRTDYLERVDIMALQLTPAERPKKTSGRTAHLDPDAVEAIAASVDNNTGYTVKGVEDFGKVSRQFYAAAKAVGRKVSILRDKNTPDRFWFQVLPLGADDVTEDAE